MRLAGRTVKEIAAYWGVTEHTVYNWFKWYPREPEILPEISAGPPLDRDVETFSTFYETYSKLYFPEHWRSWVTDYFENDRLLINVPPRHGKSKLFSVWLPMFEVCRNPNVQILLVTATGGFAKKWTNEIIWHFTHNQALIEAYGPFVPEKNSGTPWRPLQGELMVAKRTREVLMGDYTLQIKGRGEQILGSEADVIVVDDITDLDVTRSPTEREKLSEKFHGEIITRQKPSSKVVVVGQRVHYMDFYGELAAKKFHALPGEPPLWKHINYPAILDWENKITLWPREWPFAKLMERYEDMRRGHSTALFETMYQQNPLPEGANLLQREWVDGDATHPGCWDFGRQYGDVMPDLGPDWRKARVISIDPSPTRNTAIIVADVASYTAEGQSQWLCGIIELERGRMNLRDIISRLKMLVQDYQPDYLIFEVNAAQRWFLQDYEFLALNREWNLPIIYHTTLGQKKADEGYGVQSLAVDFEWGRIRLPGGDPKGRAQSEQLIEEAMQYPVGTYDDLVMSLWFIKWNHRQLMPRPWKNNAYGGDRYHQDVGLYNNFGPKKWEWM